MAPTRGQYLRGSRSQLLRALGADQVPLRSRAKTSWSTESKGSGSHLEPENVWESKTLPSFSSREARSPAHTQHYLETTDQPTGWVTHNP